MRVSAPLVLAAASLLAACDSDGGGGSSCIKLAPTLGSALFTPPEPPNPLVQVSGDSPFAQSCGQEQVCGTVYVGSEVEPYVAINPTDSQNLVGVWQQDRWSNGGAQGLLSAFSSDGGQTWNERQVPFSRCSGGNALNGGDYARATDPWVTIGADGTVYWMAMTITDLEDGQEVSAMRVSRSTDGGDTWDAPVTLIEDTNPYFNDKNAMTADPNDANYVYAVWDRLDYANNKGPAYYSRTTDGGDTWSPAAVLYDPGDEAQTVGNQVVVLSDGTALNLATQIDYGTATTPDLASLRIVRSTDHGATWTPYSTIGPLRPRGAYDPETGQQIRDGSVLGTIAVGPDDTIWVAWQDATLGGFCIPEANPCYAPYDRIAVVKSTDGGLNWSAPVLANADPNTSAFTPTLRVAADGTVGLSYYDLRDDTSDPDTILASHWLATSADGTNWSEELIGGPFDIAIAPDALGLFVGDYQGLVADGNVFVPFFGHTTGSLANRTDISVRPAAAPVAAKAARATYSATQQWWIVPDPDGPARVAENIRRQRAQQFPDRIRPDIPAHLLR